MMARGDSTWLRGNGDQEDDGPLGNALIVELHRTDADDGDVMQVTATSDGTVGSEIILGRGAAGISSTDTQLPRQNMRLFCEADASLPEGLAWRVQSTPKGRAAELHRGDIHDREVLTIPSGRLTRSPSWLVLLGRHPDSVASCGSARVHPGA